MSTPRLDDLPQVVDPTVLTDLGERLVSIANAAQSSMADVRQRWTLLSDSEVFNVSGAEAVPHMLDRPAADARSFSEALVEARNALWDAGSMEFPDLRHRREELASRIPTVVADYDSAVDASARADTVYRSTRGADVDASVAADASLVRLNASVTLRSAESALDSLSTDIDRFRRDVEDAEDRLASRLRNVAGGTEVINAAGEPVRVGQLFWGHTESAYPGAPSAASVNRTLSEQLAYVLGRAAERRIDWLSGADPDAVHSWLGDHPDFVQSVAFIDPQRTGPLFADLMASSTSAPGGEWIEGPLAQLMALAPLVVGNMYGVSAAQRNSFNLKGLSDALVRDDLDAEVASRLAALRRALDVRTRDGSRPLLVGFFFDSDGSPRANLAFGDIDSADQVTTLTHGINTDLGSVAEWSTGSSDLQAALARELERTGEQGTAAVLLVMDWDSGDTFQVWGIDRPDAGAARLAETLRGVRVTNPSAQLNVGAHSLGTTMTSQVIADNPGLVSHAWFFGSAGITPDTRDALAEQARTGQMVLSATHADADFIAPFGRKTWLGSLHPEDPRGVPGVSSFGSDGGVVVGYGSAQGEFGEATDSHDAHNSVKQEFVGWGASWDGSPSPRYEPVEQTGYLDPSAESFKHFVVGLREALETTGASQ